MRKKILLLGSGELGKEVVIALQRLGQYVIAVDSYHNAPAMQVAHDFEVINMLDGDALDEIVKKHNPNIIVPEVESIRTERFYDYEKQGFKVVPSAKAANFFSSLFLGFLPFASVRLSRFILNPQASDKSS